MGNSTIKAPTDARVERCLKRFRSKVESPILFAINYPILIFKVPQDKIEVLWQIFARNCRAKGGYLVSNQLYKHHGNIHL